MSGHTRVAVPAAALAALLALAGCAPDGGSPGGTTDDGADHGTAEDPFAPEPPTSGDGWTERYHDIPWLSDDLDNDDFFVTGSVDGHDVMGIYCGETGSGTLLSVDDNTTTVQLQTPVDIDITAGRGPNHTFIGIGTYDLPPEDRGTHAISVSLATSLDIEDSPGVDGRATPATAVVDLEMLGVPYPDPATCDDEQSSLHAWAYAAGGH